MAQIDKYGARKERNIVANMDKDNDYFVRLVFPLLLTPERVDGLRHRQSGRGFFNSFLKGEFMKNSYGIACVEVHDASRIPALEILPKRLGNSSGGELSIAYMVACVSVSRADFVTSSRNRLKIPQTPAAALACFMSESSDVMHTAIMRNMLNDSFNQVSLVFKLGDEFFSTDEVGMKDAFLSCLGPQINHEGMQRVLELDDLIG